MTRLGEVDFIFSLVRFCLTSSILRVVRAIGLATILFAWALLAFPGNLAADEVQAVQAPADAFFAGTIVETTTERITVTRVVLGHRESRTFLRTPETRVEGRLAPNVRVTVRYASDESGDTATLIVVRPPATPAKQPKKK